MKYSFEELAGMIDHSLLQPTLTDSQFEAGCALAARYKVASVCVKPYAVRRAAELLQGSSVAVGTVVGFPHGSNETQVKVFETTVACDAGAREIDMVANIGKALSGDWKFVENDIRAVCEESRRRGALVKVIIENDYLPSNEIKVKFCQVVESAGADFVKTSTGYGFVPRKEGGLHTVGATEADVILMRATCSPRVQVKAAGGVRNLDSLIRMRDLGVTRCGASATEAILEEYKQRISGSHVPARKADAGGY